MHRVSQASAQNPISCFRAWTMMLSSGCQAGVSPTPHEPRLPPQAKAKLAYGAAQPLCVGTELLSDSLQSRIKQEDTGQDESFTWQNVSGDSLYLPEWSRVPFPVSQSLKSYLAKNLGPPPPWQVEVVDLPTTKLYFFNTEFNLYGPHPPPL